MLSQNQQENEAGSWGSDPVCQETNMVAGPYSSLGGRDLRGGVEGELVVGFVGALDGDVAHEQGRAEDGGGDIAV